MGSEVGGEGSGEDDCSGEIVEFVTLTWWGSGGIVRYHQGENEP